MDSAPPPSPSVKWIRQPRPTGRAGDLALLSQSAARLPPLFELTENGRCDGSLPAGRKPSGLLHLTSKRTYTGGAAYSNSTISYDPNYLDRRPPYLRAYRLADLASYVLDLQQQKYPVRNENRGNQTQATDIIVGFLTHCLRSKENLLQKDSKDPRIWFTEYRRIGLGSEREI